MKYLQISFLLLTVALAALQLLQTPKNESSRASPDDLFAQHPAPESIRVLIHEACYDCHSNNTRYPWYQSVQPIAWWMARHIADAKDHLNFSEFGQFSPKRAARKLEESYEEVDGGTMPLASYKLMHPKARLTKDERKQILDWLDSLQNKIEPQ